MSKKEAVFIVGRAAALYFFVCALDSLTYLPGRILSLSHHLHVQSVVAADYYWRNSDVLTLGFTLVRIVLLFGLAMWLYKIGPGVEAYLLPLTEGPGASSSGDEKAGLL